MGAAQGISDMGYLIFQKKQSERNSRRVGVSHEQFITGEENIFRSEWPPKSNMTVSSRRSRSDKHIRW